MNKKIISLLVIILISLTGCYTQSVFTVRTVNDDISDNLNLEAVATLFGNSRNLQDFEARLNDPQNQISNLDLNQDGYVDYIRVIARHENGMYLVTLQDILGNDQFQDLATIYVTRNTQGPRIEIVGNPYFYGPDFVFEPIFGVRPVIFSIFWNPHHRLWRSPYYWNYYPHFFRPWRPYALYRYRSHIRPFVRSQRYYKYGKWQNYHHRSYEHGFRNDYEKMHPERDFKHRNQGFGNARDLNQKRKSGNHYIVRPNHPNQNRSYENHRVKKPAVVKEKRSNYKVREGKPFLRFFGNRSNKTHRNNQTYKKQNPKVRKATKSRKGNTKSHYRGKKKDKKK